MSKPGYRGPIEHPDDCHYGDCGHYEPAPQEGDAAVGTAKADELLKTVARKVVLSADQRLRVRDALEAAYRAGFEAGRKSGWTEATDHARSFIEAARAQTRKDGT